MTSRDINHRIDAIQYLQHQCHHLGVLCNHVDIKASIFLSLVTAMLLAYAFSPMVNLITLTGAAAFTVAVPLKIGVGLLGKRIVAIGGDIPYTGQELLSMSPADQRDHYARMVDSLRRAIAYNVNLLTIKQKQHWSIMVLSLCMFGFILAMTVVGTFIEPPTWSTYPLR